MTFFGLTFPIILIEDEGWKSRWQFFFVPSSLIDKSWKSAEMLFAMIRKGLKCCLMSLKPQIKEQKFSSSWLYWKLIKTHVFAWNTENGEIDSMNMGRNCYPYMRQPNEIYRQSIQYFIQMRVRLSLCFVWWKTYFYFIFLLCELPFMLSAHTHTQNERECHFSSSFRNFPSIWIIIHDIFIYLACMPFSFPFLLEWRSINILFS